MKENRKNHKKSPTEKNSHRTHTFFQRLHTVTRQTCACGKLIQKERPSRTRTRPQKFSFRFSDNIFKPETLTIREIVKTSCPGI